MPAIARNNETGMDQPIEDHSIMTEDIDNSIEPLWFKFYHYWIEDSPVFANAENLKLFLWLLARARRKSGHFKLKSGQVVYLDAGECIVGRQAASEALGISPSTFRNRLEKLEEFGAIKTDKKDKAFTRVSIVFPLGLKPKKDKPRTSLGQGEDKARTSLGQGEDTNKRDKMDQKNEMIERESSGDAAFPPTPEKISSLMDEYIKTRSTTPRTKELEQQIKSLKEQSEAIRTALLERVESGLIEKDSTEYKAEKKKYFKIVDEQIRPLDSELKELIDEHDLSGHQKKDLAMEFFNYWNCRDWKTNGKPIRLFDEVSVWTQREITKKHQASGGKRNALKVQSHRRY